MQAQHHAGEPDQHREAPKQRRQRRMQARQQHGEGEGMQRVTTREAEGIGHPHAGADAVAAGEGPLPARAALQRVVQRQAEALLETEGYFNAKADLSRDPDDETRLRLTVTPGPLTRVGALDIAFTEGIAEDDLKTLRDTLRSSWALKPGAAFTQSQWATSKSDLLLRARAGGFPLARWAETAARVDPDAHTADLRLVLASGNRARLGALRIEGLKRQDRETIERLTGYRSGDPYTEQKLAEFQERLAKTQLFDAVRVQLLPETVDPDGTTPVQVTVTESALQQATGGRWATTATTARASASSTCTASPSDLSSAGRAPSCSSAATCAAANWSSAPTRSPT
ncbi:surface antigen variable number repeat-containing domain protein [Ostertagia ostertagi]